MRLPLLRDERGAVMIEMTLVFMFLMILTFGIVEFGLLFWQYTSAEKATQLGVRAAVVSTPVAAELTAFDCGNNKVLPGTPCRDPLTTSFGTILCSGATMACTNGYSFNRVNFQTVVSAMQRAYPRVLERNVLVQYSDIGLGFAGRKAPVGAVTVGLTGMTFDFIALAGLLGLGPVTMPDFRATLTSEDLNSAGA